MTKVEELRKGLLLQVSMMQKHVELVDSLISAAHEEGVGQERQRVCDEEEAESLRHDQECDKESDRIAREEKLGVRGLCDYIGKHRNEM